MSQPVTRVPSARLRALRWAGLAVLMASCGAREGALPSAATSPAPPATPDTAYHLYVAQDGLDTNAGTESAPFKTITRAAEAALPGTTVHVAPGTYEGGFKTIANGTPEARVYYVSSLRWGAKIVPPLNSTNPVAWDNRGNYVDIVGFDVDGTVYRGGVKWANGIYSGGSYDVIRNNHVHHVATTVTCTNADSAGIGIDSYYHGVKSDVLGNYVHDIGPAGCIHIRGIFINTPGTVKNNIVYRVADAGIHMWHDATHVVISNNTVTGSNFGIVVGAGDFYYTSGPNDHTRVSNNLIYDNRTGIAEQGATGKNNTYTNNLVFQNTSGDWRLGKDIGHVGTVAAPPQFLDYNRNGTPDFRLASTSPAIGKGSPADAPPVDYKGRPRGNGSGIDIGAYQH